VSGSGEAARALVARHEDSIRGCNERRRAGRYYTPSFLVGELVEKVLGPLVERGPASGSAVAARRSAEEIFALRVLDPSCGAGSFLLGALDFLAEAAVARGANRDEARRRLVEETLFGIDTDDDALEVAREALALASGAQPLGLKKGDALADRGLGATVGVEGLDAVLGNPPWLREKDGRRELERARATNLGRRYGAGKMDLWFLFAHAALEVLGPGGRHGFVVPSYWLEARSARRLREHLLETSQLEEIVDLGSKRIFKDVQTRCCIYVCERVASGERSSSSDRAPRARQALVREDGTIALRSGEERVAALLDERGTRGPFEVAEGVTPGPEAWTRATAERAALALGTSAEALERERGIERGSGVFVVPLGFSLPKSEREILLPWAAPTAIPAFPESPRPTAQILYTTEEKPGPRVLAHLERFRPALDRRRETRDGKRPFWALHWPRRRELFSGPRALLPRMVAEPRAAYAEATLVTGESVLVIRAPDRETTRGIAALLNTAPLAAWLLARSKRRGVGIDVSVARAREIPWPRALLENPTRIAPVVRALERGDRAEADALAWRLYGFARPPAPREVSAGTTSPSGRPSEGARSDPRSSASRSGSRDTSSALPRSDRRSRRSGPRRNAP
jgi:adenine-specific DNA-methyltransferase